MANPIPVDRLPLLTRAHSQWPTPEEWAMGIAVLIDKPKGWSSFKAVKWVRRLTGVKKVGHAGTLDPMATGLLIICVGKATKSIEQFQGQRKEYLAETTFGGATPSYDAETDIIEEAPIDHLTLEVLQSTVESQFLGDIEQMPPMYSALKKDGQPLYKRARKGEVIERPTRPVSIYEHLLISWDSPVLTSRVTCSKGTYIRSLAHDLGEAVASKAYLSGLRRTKIGQYAVKDAFTPDEFLTLQSE